MQKLVWVSCKVLSFLLFSSWESELSELGYDFVSKLDLKLTSEMKSELDSESKYKDKSFCKKALLTAASEASSLFISLHSISSSKLLKASNKSVSKLSNGAIRKLGLTWWLAYWIGLLDGVSNQFW